METSKVWDEYWTVTVGDSTFADTDLEYAIDLATLDPGDRITVGRVRAMDAGAARLPSAEPVMRPCPGIVGPANVDTPIEFKHIHWPDGGPE